MLTQLFPPETQAGANRLRAMADILSADHDVTVVTLQPSYPSPAFFAGSGWEPHEDDGERFRVCRGASFDPHVGSFLRRGLRELVMAVRLGWLARRCDVDLVVATSPSFALGPVGFLVSKWKRVPFVWDIRDVTWRYVAEHESSRLPFAFGAIMRRLAGAVGRRAALVVGSNQGIVAEMESLGVKSNRLAHVSNGVSSELMEACGALNASGPRDRPRVTYAGALGYFQGLETFIAVAALMPDVDFTLVGDGPERSNLEARASGNGGTNVQFLGYVDRGSVLQLYLDSDILYASLRDLPALNHHTFPSKPFEYMAAGRPIVYTGGGITGEFLRSTGAALVVDTHDVAKLQQALSSILGDPLLRRELKTAARATVDRYRREDVMRAFADSVQRLVTR